MRPKTPFFDRWSVGQEVLDIQIKMLKNNLVTIQYTLEIFLNLLFYFSKNIVYDIYDD